jgi:hypothetical protein
MFLSGLEVSFDTLQKSRAEETASRWKKPVPLAFVYFVSTVALAFESALLYSSTFDIPHGDTTVRTGDTLILIGSPDALRDAHFLFGVK